MDADELRSLQAPLKERYREDTDAALIVLKASGAVDDSEIACSVDTGKALVEAGLHPSGGGTGLQACSGDMLLQALVACAGVTLRAVATALSIDIQGARVSAEGDLDVRGTLGVDRDAPVGFRRSACTSSSRATPRRKTSTSCTSSPSATASSTRRLPAAPR